MADNAGRSPTGPVLAVKHLSVAFGATQALTDVTIDLKRGEVLGLVGTNGAGKSTLINVVSGVVQPTTGHVELDGALVEMATPLAASRAGIETVHQHIDQGIIPGMSAAENLVLDAYADASMSWWVRRRAMMTRAAAIAEKMALDVDLNRPVEELAPSDRQRLIIARALARKPRLLILDEPTSTLSLPESSRLHESVRMLKHQGVSVIYISHVLADVEQLCDRVVVLRDGRVHGEFLRPLVRRDLIHAMLGELVASTELQADKSETHDVVLELVNVQARPNSPAVVLSVRRGEIVGLTGLIGAGKTELLEQVFGQRPLIAGKIRLLGRSHAPRQPADAVLAGIAFVPEDRSSLGIVPTWSVTANLTLPFLRKYGHLGFIRRQAERSVTARFVDQMRIQCAGVDADIESLSGGNQQKVVVARWLQSDSPLLILDEPFRGIDIGSRAEIVAQLRAQRDRAVIVASSDPEEILEVADRVVVLAGGAVVGEVSATEATTSRLIELMAGGLAA